MHALTRMLRYLPLMNYRKERSLLSVQWRQCLSLGIGTNSSQGVLSDECTDLLRGSPSDCTYWR